LKDTVKGTVDIVPEESISVSFCKEKEDVKPAAIEVVDVVVKDATTKVSDITNSS
jgi:hypothetical protein